MEKKPKHLPIECLQGTIIIYSDHKKRPLKDFVIRTLLGTVTVAYSAVNTKGRKYIRGLLKTAIPYVKGTNKYQVS